MKVAARCLGCNKVVRFYGSFTVKLTKQIKNPLTGDVREVGVKGKLCRSCATVAGYKVKGSMS